MLDSLKEKANDGNIKAQLMLGGMYGGGFGVDKDEKEAFKWYKMAADNANDDGRASSIVGNFYSNGIGTDKSDSLAVVYFKKASDKGHVFATLALGYCYLTGKGTTQNSIKAKKCFDAAKNAGWRIPIVGSLP